jgi:hypothetical protein
MKTIKEYCINNINALINYQQQPFGWRNNYDVQALLSIPDFRAVNPEIPNEIDRGHIIKNIRDQKYYQAYAEILFWGLIGMRPRSNKSKRTEIAKKALAHSKAEIETIFTTIKKGNANGIEELYLSLEQGGGAKIAEVDASYFTKLLAFGSEASGYGGKLLIYDKWTRLIHVHLLLDQDETEYLSSIYTTTSLSKLWYKKDKAKSCSTDIIYPRKNKGYEAYIDYCNRMNALAVELSDRTDREIKGFQLESFLFGSQLRKNANKVTTNPRYWIQQNFAANYLHVIHAL